MCHQEVVTNPRYKDMKYEWNEPPPPPLNDVNDVTWSIIISLIILLIGVGYYIYTIMSLAFKELEDGSNDTAEQKEPTTSE